jgi:hypothetical protein
MIFRPTTPVHHSLNHLTLRVTTRSTTSHHATCIYLDRPQHHTSLQMQIHTHHTSTRVTSPRTASDTRQFTQSAPPLLSTHLTTPYVTSPHQASLHHSPHHTTSLMTPHAALPHTAPNQTTRHSTTPHDMENTTLAAHELSTRHTTCRLAPHNGERY